MYLDKLNFYSEGQNLAAGVSEHVIDFGAGGEAYEAPWLGVTITPALFAGQSVTVEVQASDEEAFTAPETLATFNSAENGQSGLAIGQRLPRSGKRYSRLNYKVNGGATGKVTAYLTSDLSLR